MGSECLFCRIAAGEHPAEVVFSDDVSIGFLDIRPVFHGHTLLIPCDHHETLADLPAELIERYFTNVQLLSRAIPAAMGAQGSFVAINNVVSQSVAHLHCHVVPRVKKDGLRGFFWPRHKYSHDEHMVQTAESIRAELGRLGRV
jgi:histidine triad (HIT) family protein